MAVNLRKLIIRSNNPIIEERKNQTKNGFKQILMLETIFLVSFVPASYFLYSHYDLPKYPKIFSGLDLIPGGF